MTTIEDKYKKLSQREHLLQRPGMYIGKIFDEVDDVWILNSGKMEKKGLKYNPGILKLFDEIILNALDQFHETNKVTEIDVLVTPDNVSIRNDGPGIPIVKHKEHGVYIPELIFSQFLTSTNYDDDQKRIKSGLNGLGAKITSTFSKLFQIETVSGGKVYQQNFMDNLDTIENPTIGNTKSKDYTKITFFPDFKRFKVKCITPSTIELLKKRTYDIAAFTNKKVKNKNRATLSASGDTRKTRGGKDDSDVGRPEEDVDYGTQRAPRGRDPLGNETRTRDVKNRDRSIKFAAKEVVNMLRNDKKVALNEKSMLDENNLLSEEDTKE